MQKSCAGLATGWYFGASGSGQTCTNIWAIWTLGFPLQQLRDPFPAICPLWAGLWPYPFQVHIPAATWKQPPGTSLISILPPGHPLKIKKHASETIPSSNRYPPLYSQLQQWAESDQCLNLLRPHKALKEENYFHVIIFLHVKSD